MAAGAIACCRVGKTWFIAGINGTTNDLPVTLDLSPYKSYPHRIAVTEGTNVNMQVIALPLEDSAMWQHTMPPRGGFILRLDK